MNAHATDNGFTGPPQPARGGHRPSGLVCPKCVRCCADAVSDRVPGRWASPRQVLFAMGVCLPDAQMTISLVSCSVPVLCAGQRPTGYPRRATWNVPHST